MMGWGIGWLFWLVVRFLGDRGAHEGRLHIFLFCHAGGLAPAARHIAGSHDSVLSEDCSHQSRSALGGVNDDGVVFDDCVGADGGLWETKSM